MRNKFSTSSCYTDQNSDDLIMLTHFSFHSTQLDFFIDISHSNSLLFLPLNFYIKNDLHNQNEIICKSNILRDDKIAF